MTRVRDTFRPAPDTPPPALALMLAVLTDHEATPGGVCVGRAPLWDPEVDGETCAEQVARLTAAREGCQQCPVRLTCPAPVRRVSRAG